MSSGTAAAATATAVAAKGNAVVSFFKKLLHVVEVPLTSVKKIEQIFEAVDQGIASAPEAKTLITGLVKQFETISPDVVSAIAGDGVNIVADEKSLADVSGLFSYFKNTFVPGIEQVYQAIKADLTGYAAPAPAPAPAAVAEPAPAPAPVAVASTGAAE
jgi:hypothetical protein